jgi:uncharacterized protein YdeI (YjbR/CyaY-like superfamily)
LRSEDELVKIGQTLHVASRRDFRRWLAEYHRNKKQVWLILYKKSTGKQTVSPDDALEEAICFGWIDNRIESIDTERFAIRFTPRRKGSAWSEYNRKIPVKMLRRGRMTKRGMAVLPLEFVRIKPLGQRMSRRNASPSDSCSHIP